MIIIGINSAYHEQSAAVIVDGQLAASAEEERFNRVKHGKHSRVDNADVLPWRALEYCLQAAGVTFADVDRVAYSFDPWARYLHNWPDKMDGVADGDFGSRDGEERFFRSHLRARDLLSTRMPHAQVCFLPHHLCHAASAFLASPFTSAGILVVDGIAESASTWTGLGLGNSIRKLSEVDYPSSLGFLWERVSEFLGFDRYDGPGKVMALGTSLDSRSLLSGVPYLDRFRQFVRPTADGGFFIEPDVLRYRARDFDGLEKVLGPRCGILNEPREVAAVAAGLQLITEEILCFITEHLFRSLNSKNPSPHTSDLCMAGGVALNCVANARILERTSWNRIWVQPAANDAGTALGAALAIWNLDLGHSERVALGNVFQGPEFSDRQYEAALVKAGFSYRRPRNQSRGIAEKLAQGAAIGLFQGRMEFGPRALGNRSILADPRRRETRQILNRKVKERESFRPFAPSILADRVAEMFEFPASIDRSIGNPADFMLLTVPVKAGCEERIPSAIHTNLSTNASSARVHLVAAQPSTGSLRAILEEFDSLTGCPALLNTSMNVSEPIVCTPDHACATFLRSGLDILSLGYYLVERAQ